MTPFPVVEVGVAKYANRLINIQCIPFTTYIPSAQLSIANSEILATESYSIMPLLSVHLTFFKAYEFFKM